MLNKKSPSANYKAFFKPLTGIKPSWSNKIFDNPAYPTLISVSMLTVLILITFSFLNIFQQTQPFTIQSPSITAKAIEQIPPNPIFAYYLILITIIIAIIITLVKFKSTIKNAI